MFVDFIVIYIIFGTYVCVFLFMPVFKLYFALLLFFGYVIYSTLEFALIFRLCLVHSFFIQQILGSVGFCQ